MSGYLVLIALMSLVLQSPVEERNSDFQNIGHRNINKGSVAISRDREFELGQQLRAGLEQKVKLFQQPEVLTYINSIVQLLGVNSDATIPIASGIIESDEIDSIGLPGGTVYVTTGLIRAADNEAELAAAVAHAIAHIAARHTAEMVMKAELLDHASIPLLAGKTSDSPPSQTAVRAMPAQLRAFARKNVAEADFLSLQYLYRAGWDPDAAIRFLQKMQTRQGTKAAAASPLPAEASGARYIGNPSGTVDQMLQAEPPIDARIERLRRQRENLPARVGDRVNTVDFDRAKMIVSTTAR
jgi:beta-barrel assembly-enhancing protease